eukprot:731105-Pleurochrysis_carterae.AAC.2
MCCTRELTARVLGDKSSCNYTRLGAQDACAIKHHTARSCYMRHRAPAMKDTLILADNVNFTSQNFAHEVLFTAPPSLCMKARAATAYASSGAMPNSRAAT